MVDAPERIWVHPKERTYWTTIPPETNTLVQFVRADIAASQLAEARAERDQIDNSRTFHVARAIKAEAERDELKSIFDARVQEMSERFRAVNVAEALKQLGPDHVAMAERLQAAEAERDRLAADNARKDVLLRNLLSAWDVLPEGRYSAGTLGHWLVKNMHPAIEPVRAILAGKE